MIYSDTIAGAPPPPPPPYTGYHHIVTDQVTVTRPGPQVQVTAAPGPPVMSPDILNTSVSSGVRRLSQQLEARLSLSEDPRPGQVITDTDIYPKILVQRSASQAGGHLDTEIYPSTVMQRSASQLEDLYPHLRMQRTASGGRLGLDTEIYPKILMQRSASQMSGQPQGSMSQLSGDTEIYPQLIRAQRGSTPLTMEDTMYPRVLASNGQLIQVPLASNHLSQQQIDEIYPKLLKQQLNSSVQLSQLPGAQLSTSVLAQQQQQHLLQQHQLQKQQQLQQQQLQQQQQMQTKYLQAQYEEELPIYENVYEKILVNNQTYNNQLDYVNLPPPPPYPGTNGHVSADPGHVTSHVASHVTHVRNLSDTSGQSESSSGSLLSHKSPAQARLGWYETELDSSSDTLTPLRAPPAPPVSSSPHLRPALLPHSAHVHLATNESAVSGLSSNQQQPHTPPQTRGQPLLPFSVTPPRPPGPSEAEMKVEALTRELEEEMDKREQQSEFFGACHACNEKVTGAGQACQVRQSGSYLILSYQ